MNKYDRALKYLEANNVNIIKLYIYHSIYDGSFESANYDLIDCIYEIWLDEDDECDLTLLAQKIYDNWDSIKHNWREVYWRELI